MRIAIAVIAGYVVMAAGVIAASLGIMFGWYDKNQFQEGTLDPAPAVSICMLAAAALAAVLAGFVAAKIARAKRRVAMVWLTGIILVLGAVSAAGDWTRAQALAQTTYSTEEIAKMSTPEKMEKAHKPMWLTILVPFIGAGSALLGFRLAGPGATEVRPTRSARV